MLYWYCSKCDLCSLKQKTKCYYCKSFLRFYCSFNNNSGTYHHYVTYHINHCSACNPTLKQNNNLNNSTPYPLYISVFNRENKCN